VKVCWRHSMRCVFDRVHKPVAAAVPLDSVRTHTPACWAAPRWQGDSTVLAALLFDRT
jgi:hypothetical protein